VGCGQNTPRIAPRTQTPNFQLPTPIFQLPTPNFQLPTPNSQLLSRRHRSHGNDIAERRERVVAPVRAANLDLPPLRAERGRIGTAKAQRRQAGPVCSLCVLASWLFKFWLWLRAGKNWNSEGAKTPSRAGLFPLCLGVLVVQIPALAPGGRREEARPVQDLTAGRPTKSMPTRQTSSSKARSSAKVRMTASSSSKSTPGGWCSRVFTSSSRRSCE